MITVPGIYRIDATVGKLQQGIYVNFNQKHPEEDMYTGVGLEHWYGSHIEATLIIPSSYDWWVSDNMAFRREVKK